MEDQQARSHYDAAFYERIRAGSTRSAQIVLPVAFDWTGLPTSVVDVGCGSGAWLVACQTLGVPDILGMDGTHVNPESLLIPKDQFVTIDLETPPPIPRRFDLAMSLEVGEHIPTRCSAAYVAFLTGLSDWVLFSAAIPGQGGVHHVNEQRPAFWQRLFNDHGYVMLDPIRPRIWHDPDVEMFYAQNALLYVKESLVKSTPRLDAERQRVQRSRLTVIYQDIAWGDPDVPAAARTLAQALRRSIRHHLGL